MSSLSFLFPLLSSPLSETTGGIGEQTYASSLPGQSGLVLDDKQFDEFYEERSVLLRQPRWGIRIRENNGIWWICQIRGLSYLLFKAVEGRGWDVQAKWENTREEERKGDVFSRHPHLLHSQLSFCFLTHILLYCFLFRCSSYSRFTTTHVHILSILSLSINLSPLRPPSSASFSSRTPYFFVPLLPPPPQPPNPILRFPESGVPVRGTENWPAKLASTQIPMLPSA